MVEADSPRLHWNAWYTHGHTRAWTGNMAFSGCKGEANQDSTRDVTRRIKLVMRLSLIPDHQNNSHHFQARLVNMNYSYMFYS